MPVGKYYCDYCDKYLQDTPTARKRHLLALSHQRARSLWYQSFSSTPPAPPLAICHHFVRTGFCKYGDDYKYFHPPLAQPVPGTFQPPLTIPGVPKVGSQISVENLPPSLRPPPDGGYPALPFIDWG